MIHDDDPPPTRGEVLAAFIALFISTLLIFGLIGWATHHALAAAPEPTVAPFVELPPITAPAHVPQVAVADRLSPMIQTVPLPTAPPCNEAGLHCLPFYDGDPNDLCAELNFYRMQNPVTAAEPRFSDQPRNWDSPRTMGIGWRESNCNNTLTNQSGTKCCGGYYQIGWGNISAPGYKAFGVWSNCGITRASDYVGASPLQKQKSVCAAAGLYEYHRIHGPYPMHPWDSYL